MDQRNVITISGVARRAGGEEDQSGDTRERERERVGERHAAEMADSVVPPLIL